MKEFPIDYVKIQDRKMVRDMHSKAVVNTDMDGLQAYRDRRRTADDAKNTIAEVAALRTEINSMKNDLDTIKELLMGMANK